jgi:hypothetical protein
MDVRGHGQDFVWYRVLLVTQHPIVDSCMHSTLMCEVEQSIVEGCCVFVLKAQFDVLGTMTR